MTASAPSRQAFPPRLVGNTVSRCGRWPVRSVRAATALALTLAVFSAAAIDNPDAPDRIGAFERRAAPYAERLDATSGGSASVREGAAYARFLNDELNQAYQALLSKLRGPTRWALVDSQRRWLQYRDAEFRFVDQHWTTERSGSSASLSAAAHRAAVVRTRVLALLPYGAEYP